jgi:hypothetical protein
MRREASTNLLKAEDLGTTSSRGLIEDHKHRLSLKEKPPVAQYHRVM